MIWFDQASKRLEAECKADMGRHGNIMKSAVKAALLDFCRQDDEFAQAVVQGGTFKACMEAVAKNVGSGISDLEAYKRAVSFYFPGAGIRMTMKIDLCDSVNDTPHPDGPGIVLDLSDYMT